MHNRPWVSSFKASRPQGNLETIPGLPLLGLECGVIAEPDHFTNHAIAVEFVRARTRIEDARYRGLRRVACGCGMTGRRCSGLI